MSDLVIFDTSVIINGKRDRRYSERIAEITSRIRLSSVVLAELWRGAIAPIEQKFLLALVRSRPILTPTENNWLESGQILAKIHHDQGFQPHKLRDLHFDVLIALTARTHGARLITSNRTDFELIRKYRAFKLEVW